MVFAGPSKNGFDLSHSSIPPEEILSGGPPRDGIPAISKPKFTDLSKAEWLRPKDIVVGVRLKGEARAYPLRILVWHENVNDVVAGVPLAVTYCPLCNSVLVFHREIDGRVRDFGISGLLWNSNVLLFDRNPEKAGQESLWNQGLMKAVSGPAAQKGLRLELFPSEMTTWEAWRKAHPSTKVLSQNTGHYRDYDRNPYGDYFTSPGLFFPVRTPSASHKRFTSKEMVAVVYVGGKAKAYGAEAIKKAGGSISDSFGGARLKVTYLSEARSLRVERLDAAGGGDTLRVPVAYLYGFVANTMHPQITVY